MRTVRGAALTIAAVIVISLASGLSERSRSVLSSGIPSRSDSFAEFEDHEVHQLRRLASKAPRGRVQRLSTSSTCPVQGDLEGAFVQSSEMSIYLECVLPAIEQWIDATYRQMQHPKGYYFVPAGVSGGSVNCPYDSDSLGYCPESEKVFLGEKSIWRQYRLHGDAAPAVVLAHEVTHHFQNEVQMSPAETENDQIRYENQADCGAGAFMRRELELGRMNVEDDILDLAGSLGAGAQVESGERTHGTIQERLQSFDQGYRTYVRPPLAACSEFVPEQPIVGSP